MCCCLAGTKKHAISKNCYFEHETLYCKDGGIFNQTNKNLSITTNLRCNELLLFQAGFQRKAYAINNDISILVQQNVSN